MADFELRNEERVAPAPGNGGRVAAPEPVRRSTSVWLAVLVKGVGILILMFSLAAIGAASMIYGKDGVAVAHGANPSEIGSAWLANEAREFAEGDGGMPPSRAPGAGVTADGKVILNLASADELRRLPGVGKRRAEAIVALRDKLKRFRKVSDLLRVRGLGPRGVKRIQPHVLIDPPPETSAGDAGAPDAFR
jgi:competence protein ComEA